MIGLGYASPAKFLLGGFEPRRTFACPRDGGGSGMVAKRKPKVSELLQGIEVVVRHGRADGVVTDLCMDSRRVTPGALFFALPGFRTNGAHYIEEAIDRGAIAVVAESARRPNPKVAYFQVNDARLAMALVARRFFQDPDEGLNVHAITGTNGKTTVSYLTRFLLGAAERPSGMIGTIEFDLGSRTVPAYRTTPESIELFGMMAQMKAAGLTDMVMEASSHGIDQHRLHGVHCRTATFLNLTRDHLDYHGDIDTYFRVKSRLFTGENGNVPEAAILNADDPRTKDLQKMISPDTRQILFGEAAEANIRATDIELQPLGTTLRLHWPEGSAKVRSPLVGRYNVSNLLAAVAIVYAQGIDPMRILPHVSRFGGIPGRMQKIEEGQPFPVLVDYAHTDDALRNALGMLRAITPGKLLVVYGCGGNRDRTKRPAMTQAVLDLADEAWATSDNPRKERVEDIFADMREGLPVEGRIHFVEDRRQAISKALDEAGPDDCVLIAGKGHESFQEYGDTILPFDDRQVAAELLRIKTYRQGADHGG